MLPLTVIIMARNEAHRITRCIEALRSLNAEVLVATNQCSDNTAEKALSAGARVIDLPWLGYAATKNEAHKHARFDWILSLDADEVANETLCSSLVTFMQTNPSPHTIGTIKRRLVIGDQTLYHGSVSREYRLRLFHRHHARWNTHAVHEDIEYDSPKNIVKLDGWVWHYSFDNFDQHREKLKQYAELFAKQYAQKHKSVSGYKFLSAYWGLIKNYLFRGGFLDGQAGWLFAINEFNYTRNKYRWVSRFTTNASESGK